jgi:acyl-CoA hydrolase
MPRTFGDSFVHVNSIDMLVPHDEEVVVIPVPEPDETLRRIGQNVARLVEDASTIECGIGRIPQALAEFLKDKKDLGVHTEMFSDWIIELIECGAITCAKKSVNRGKIVASFCVGARLLRASAWAHDDSMTTLTIIRFLSFIPPSTSTTHTSSAGTRRWWRSMWGWRST